MGNRTIAPSTENLFKLAEIFGTTVDILLASKEQEKNSPAEQIYYLSGVYHQTVIGNYFWSQSRRSSKRTNALRLGDLGRDLLLSIIAGILLERFEKKAVE